MRVTIDQKRKKGNKRKPMKYDIIHNALSYINPMSHKACLGFMC